LLSGIKRRGIEVERAVGLVEPVEQLGEVLAGEVPLERLGDFVVAVFEGVERPGELGGVLEVVGVEQLARDDRVVELDLVEPAGVEGEVDEDQRRPAALEPFDRCLAAMVGAVVDDPEDAPGRGVGLFGHDLPDEPVERGDAALALGAPHDLAAPHVPGVEVGDGAEASYSCSTRWPRPGAGGALSWRRLRAWIEGLASAQITKSPGSSSLPSKRPW
jgi:hypothetical protein